MSLRDVERTMIVFEYMYGMMCVFESLMDELAEKELAESVQDDVIDTVRK